MAFKQEDFIELILSKIENMEVNYIDLVSGDIHRELGGYPGRSHSMPTCCKTMRKMMISDDEVLFSPPKGNGATLKIRYNKRQKFVINEIIVY